ncbi:hypothetical protein CcaverHIS002_0304530 [Cutaneotrichosporon cavernicola]|uniref:Uncharacterized protein n=1 Tax=Cutaneotrichosporon cavernicola TaxID=279322 RepID=A0AA48KZD5_9TREE|nr:uncharacterized protein CcaverHIS019_0304490 [Cutaneotrichosporon cavernicola]BEI82585.1 hypothetical protein CcaverHIS002_0304530 [Cutaneotrichosporon cavernicola]BEI90379.1 hypothetical protein CcaverHIS019_0304490 [Cutaneotrichosporon cavernicola]BEI98155.1 hypothetical protein CcaverHIS631_0304540 [Cutaneotrichosporon cavernicola]BEJ05932.1 hypothetical protein CcaverHIS641_0304540 [Cutaneotrichosporon cavernicola]
MGKPAPREADSLAMDMLRAMHREVLTREPLRTLVREGDDLRLQTILDAAASGDEGVMAAWETFVNRFAADRGGAALPRRPPTSDPLLDATSATPSQVAARVLARDSARSAAGWTPFAESYWNAEGRSRRIERANEREATPAPTFVYDEPPEHLQPGTPRNQQEDNVRPFGVSGSMSASGSVSFPRTLTTGLPRRRRRSPSPPLSEESMSWLREYGTQRRPRDESPPLRRVRRRLDGRRFGIVFDTSGMPITAGATPDEVSGREGGEPSESRAAVGEESEAGGGGGETPPAETGPGAAQDVVAVAVDAYDPVLDLPFPLMPPHDMFLGIEDFTHEEV